MRRISLVLSVLALVAALLVVEASPAAAYTPTPDDSPYAVPPYAPDGIFPICWTIDCGDPALSFEVPNSGENLREYVAAMPTL